MKFAVQVYSVRDAINDTESLLKALEEIKKIGYDGVEFAGYFGADAKTIKAKLDELGLTCVGGHIGLDDFDKDNLEKTIEFQHILGVNAIGVGGAPHRTKIDCVHTGKVLGDAQKYALDKYGMKVYYHNHCEEFKPLANGEYPIDIIGSFCSLEIDTYWSFYAGVDNKKFLTENKDNIILLHLKDGIDGHPKALGEGNCDIDAVVAAAKEMDLQWVVVENDDPMPNGFEDIARSLKFIKAKF